MTQEEILKLAETVRNGTATEDDRLKLMQALNANLGAAKELLAKMPKKK